MTTPRSTLLRTSLTRALAVLALGLGLVACAPLTSDAPAEPLQASCGDNRCSPPEDCETCPRDCGSCCGDGRCQPPEDGNSCPQDCD